MNRKTFGVVAVAVLTLVSAPLLADKRLDDAVLKADEQFQKGKVDDALKTLQKAVSQDPTAEPYLALGRLQERAGNIDEAAESLKKAADLSAAGSPAVRGSALAALSGMDLRHGS
jgi:Flp pilus assembly protein TadD